MLVQPSGPPALLPSYHVATHSNQVGYGVSRAPIRQGRLTLLRIIPRLPAPGVQSLGGGAVCTPAALLHLTTRDVVRILTIGVSAFHFLSLLPVWPVWPRLPVPNVVRLADDGRQTHE